LATKKEDKNSETKKRAKRGYINHWEREGKNMDQTRQAKKSRCVGRAYLKGWISSNKSERFYQWDSLHTEKGKASINLKNLNGF